jgi:hypothetical protein
MLVHHKFICYAADSPHTPAIRHRETVITRKQLNLWSNHVCNYLLSHNIRGIVPLVAPKSIGCIIGIVGILKAGCSYVLFHSDSELLHGYDDILLSPRISITKTTASVHIMTTDLLQNDCDGYLDRSVEISDFAYRVYSNATITDISHSQLIDFFIDYKSFFSFEDGFHRNLLDDDWNGYVLYCLFFGKCIIIDGEKNKYQSNVDLVSYGSSFVETIFVCGDEVLPRRNSTFSLSDMDYKIVDHGAGTLVVESGRSRRYTKLVCQITNKKVYYCKVPQLLEVRPGLIGYRFFF